MRHDISKVRRKNVANMADKKKTLEITGLFCRELVRQLADKERVRKYVAHWASW
jgi:hypothetical protein